MRNARNILPGIFLFAALSPANGQLYFCDRPREPSCIDTLAVLRDEVTFQSCRYDMEDFRRRVREYVECLHNEQDDAIRVLNKTKDRFNECARSHICY
jgi:hypothetical protein